MNPAFHTRSRVNMENKSLQTILQEAQGNISNHQEAENFRNLLATTLQNLENQQNTPYQSTPRRSNNDPRFSCPPQSNWNSIHGGGPRGAAGLPNLDQLSAREPSMQWDYQRPTISPYQMYNVSNKAQASSTQAQSSFFDRLNRTTRPNQSLNETVVNQSDLECLDRVYKSRFQSNLLLDFTTPDVSSPILTQGDDSTNLPADVAAAPEATLPADAAVLPAATSQAQATSSGMGLQALYKQAPHSPVPYPSYGFIPQFRAQEPPLAKFSGLAEE